MTIQTDLKREDFDAFTRFVARRAIRANRGMRWVVALAAAAGSGLVMAMALNFSGLGLDLASFAAGAITLVLWLLVITRVRVFRLGPAAGGLALGPRSVSTGDEGIRLTSARQDSLFRWVAVRSVEIAPQHVYVMLDANAAIIMPNQSFVSAAQREEFVQEIRTKSRPDSAKLAIGENQVVKQSS